MASVRTLFGSNYEVFGEFLLAHVKKTISKSKIRAASVSGLENNLQKHTLSPEEILSDLLNTEAPPKRPVCVVGSLLDNTPNVAGMARTCEIFGVE